LILSYVGITKHYFLGRDSSIESHIRALNPKVKFVTVIAVAVLIVSTPTTA
jgi:hypothetical protein